MSEDQTPEDEQRPDHDDESDWENVELTPEQVSAFHRSLEPPELKSALAKFTQAGAMRFGLAETQRKLAASFANIAASFARSQPQLTEIAASLSKTAGLSAAQAGLAAKLTIPTIAADPKWMQHYGKLGVDSDIFKTYTLAQPNLTNLTARLVGNTEFGQGIATKALADFARNQAQWLGSVSEQFLKIRRAFYPPNLRDIEDITFELVEQVVMVDGIALYGVPRASIAEALLHADGAGKRREILGRRWKQISADCRLVVDGLDDCLADYSRSATAALDALDADNSPAAQALAASIVDTLIRLFFKKQSDRQQFLPDRKGKRTTSEYNKLGARSFIAFAPIWQAYQQFHTEDGDPIPRVFSRHASAHTVSRRQFNRRNAVQAIMLACGLLCYLDERIAAATSS